MYDTSHIWYNITGNQGILGITDYLQQSIGDIAFISTYHLGEHVNPNQIIIEIETMKINLELFLPFAVKILHINSLLEDNPEVIGKDPYGNGWILKFEILEPMLIRSLLMNAMDYTNFINGEIEKSAKE